MGEKFFFKIKRKKRHGRVNLPTLFTIYDPSLCAKTKKNMVTLM